MRIGIILHPYGEDKPGGLARTIFEWAKGLLEIDQENEYIIFLKNIPQNRLLLPGNNWRVEVLGSGLFWKNRLKKASLADVYLFQTPVLPFFYTPRKSIIITQDYPYKMLKAGSLKNWLKYKLMGWYHGNSLRRADAIIAASQSSKNDSVKFFNILENKITVIYMGYKKICEVAQEFVDIPKPYFMNVGAVKERKNTLNIVRAFAEFKEKYNLPHRLVVAGGVGNFYSQKVIKFIKEKNLEKEVIFPGHLNDGQMSYLYRNTTALVFPSIVESFGMPVLEAMDCGIPVITTKYQGPSEIGKDSAILVDPNNLDEISRAMNDVISNDSLRDKIIQKGLRRAEDFSWRKTAKKTLDLIKTLS